MDIGIPQVELPKKDNEMKSMLLFAASLAAFTGFGQEKTLSILVNAFNRGNVSAIEAELLDEVDLTIQSFDDICSKSETSNRLRSFFSKNSPSSFSIIHKGENKPNGTFRIGELVTSSGTYRVTLFLEKSNSSYKVSELKIE